MKIKSIGITYDLRTDYQPRIGEPKDANAEFDQPVTVDAVVAALETLGFQVKRIGNVYRLLENLDNLGVDLVFNIAEGVGNRNRESQVPVILETKQIPFVGSDGLTLGVTLDKVLTKKLFVSEGIPTPRFFEVRSFSELNTDHLRFPLIVKPRYEGSSKGLSEKSRVENQVELKEQITYIITNYHQPALVEEFIRGYEFTVAIIGNNPPEVFAPVQTKIDGQLIPGDLFYTFGRLMSPERIEYIFPPQIEERLQKNIMELALKVYQAVECRDFGRVDFRVDTDGKPYVLEINPLPCLSTEDVFMTIAKNMGITYAEMIGKIVKSAVARYNPEL